MKLKNICVSVFAGLLIAFGLASCSNDDTNGWRNIPGSKVNLPQTRGFILNQGSMNDNNSFVEAFDFSNDTICASKLFLAQNGSQIGDTGEDLIVSGDDMFLSVNGSGYVAKLNAVGMLEHKFDFTSIPKLGLPEFEVVSGKYLYVTSTGAYVVKLNKSDLSFVDTVKVASGAQGIIISGGKIYSANSGMGEGNTMSVIDEGAFTLEENVVVCNDPVNLYCDANGNIFIMGYDANWNTVLYSYDKQAKTVTEIGNASNVLAVGDDLYIASTMTDWSTYVSTTTFYTYNTTSKTKSDASFLKNAPAELSSATIYAFNANQYTGDIYLATTDFATNGIVYHFAADGTYKSTFSSGGINPCKIIFMR